jgi:gliding motility associated protien GldN
MKNCVILKFVIVVLLIPSASLAQESGYNQNSVKHIHDSDIMYKREVWRRMDMNEKQNLPFFASGNEISKILIEAVKTGKLKPYKNDSLTTPLEMNDFLERLKIPGSDDPNNQQAAEDDGWGGTATTDKKTTDAPVSNEFLPREASLLVLKEDRLFDKKRSRMYDDIQSITLVIPGSNIATGLDRELATFAYKDLVEFFKKNADKAFWFNPGNTREHKNYADAFELRLFKARIIKVSNPNNSYIQDEFANPKDALLASEMKDHELMEYEHNLWEY